MSGSIDDWATEPLYISGNPQSTDPVTFDTGNTGFTDSPNSGSDWGATAGSVAKALKELQGGLQGANKQGGASSPSGTPSGQAASGTGQGSPAGINALIQMLMQRTNAYFPGQPNRQPVALARPSGGGLLGI